MPLTFSELSIGSDFRSSTYYLNTSNTFSNKQLNSHAFGITGKFQSSFVINYLIPQTNRRIQVGDMLATELSIGRISSKDFAKVKGLWLAYRYDFGVQSLWHVNRNMDFGVLFTMLKFSRDLVSQNISGSNVNFKFRYKEVSLETVLEVRRDRIFGWILPISGDDATPLQTTVVIRYLMPASTNFGVRVEILSGERNILKDDLFNFSKIFSVKLFYGIYF